MYLVSQKFSSSLVNETMTFYQRQALKQVTDDAYCEMATTLIAGMACVFNTIIYNSQLSRIERL
jgi:hypothetical protein